MNDFIPSVTRGSFSYHDTLFATVGEGKKHPRASVAELTALLRPEKKRTPPKDQVGHWYEAQLLHYGLQRTKDKNTGKLRILQALNEGKLEVPSDLVKMEAEMKREYTAAVRKAKANTGTTSAPAKGISKTTSKKRARSDDEELPSLPDAEALKGNSPPKPRTKQTARRSKPFLRYADRSPSRCEVDSDADMKLTSTTPPTAARPRPTARRGKQAARSSRASVRAGEASGASAARSSKNSYPNSTPDTFPDHDAVGSWNVCGTWDISCPDIEENWSSYGGSPEMTIYITSHPGYSEMWATFDFDGYEGVMRFLKPNLKKSGFTTVGPESEYRLSDTLRPSQKHATWHFQWRGREPGEGEICLGSDREVHTMKFTKNGTALSGALIGPALGAKGAKFTGVRVDGPVTSRRSVDSHWMDYSEEQYEEERAERWR